MVLVSTFSHRFKIHMFRLGFGFEKLDDQPFDWVHVAPPQVTLNNLPEKSFGVSWEEEYSIKAKCLFQPETTWHRFGHDADRGSITWTTTEIGATWLHGNNEVWYKGIRADSMTSMWKRMPSQSLRKDVTCRDIFYLTSVVATQIFLMIFTQKLGKMNPCWLICFNGLVQPPCVPPFDRQVMGPFPTQHARGDIEVWGLDLNQRDQRVPVLVWWCFTTRNEYTNAPETS